MKESENLMDLGGKLSWVWRVEVVGGGGNGGLSFEGRIRFSIAIELDEQIGSDDSLC